MYVAARPMTEPVMLVEHFYVHDGRRRLLRVLIFREGLMTRPVLRLLARLLHDI